MEVIKADILLDKGIIKGIGHVGRLLSRFEMSEQDAVVHDVKGSWVIPGLVCIAFDSLGSADSGHAASWICILTSGTRLPLGWTARRMITPSRDLLYLG